MWDPKPCFFELFDVHPYGRYETSGHSLNDPMGEDLDKWYQVVMTYLPENEI